MRKFKLIGQFEVAQNRNQRFHHTNRYIDRYKDTCETNKSMLRTDITSDRVIPRKMKMTI